MLDWSQLARKIESSTRTSEKTHLLAEAMRRASDTELLPLCRLLSNSPYSGRVSVGWAAIARAAEEVAGAPEGSLAKLMDASGDLGIAVEELLESERPIAGPAAAADEQERAEVRRIKADAKGDSFSWSERGAPALEDLADTLAAISAASGQRRHDLLVQYLYRCSPLAVKYLVRLVSGGVRIGLRDGLLEGAMAEAFSIPIAEIRRALLLEGDPGRVAELARSGRIAEAQLRYFHAIPSALASQAPVLSAAFQRFAEIGVEGLVAEEKYDGIRAQLHIADGQAALFGRDTEDISVAFPEIIGAAMALGGEEDTRALLDGEIIAVQDGVRLSSDHIQARLRGRETTLREREQHGVQFVAFDLLARGERLLVDQPLAERRTQLESLRLAERSGGVIIIGSAWPIHNLEALEQALVAAHMQGSEGLVVKALESPYASGQRSSHWIKIKRSAQSLDCVVVGADLGLGRRQRLLSELTFAVRDDLSGRLTTIGRASAQLGDIELASLSRWFEEHTIAQLGNYRSVEPRLVVEVHFADLRRSGRTSSGYRLRNPHIVRIRHDLGPDQATTLSSVETLAGAGKLQGGDTNG